MARPWSFSPCAGRPDLALLQAQAGRLAKTITIRARREDRKPRLAMSRAELAAYSQSPNAVAHASVNAALASLGAGVKLRPGCLQRSLGEKMSIFGKIMSAIFGTKADASPAGGGTAAGAGGSSAAPAATVDVAPILDAAVKAKGEKLAWRTSIVDLMKALDIDSSFSARKELAKELGYTGDSNDSASMNIWLHKQVMTKLAANGGKLPPEIKH